MKEATVTIKFKEGLHARPAVKLVKLAAGHQATITLAKGENSVPASSITAILGACITYGDVITIRAEGPDEEQAIEALEQYLA